MRLTQYIGVVTIDVRDQDRAKEFYTEKLRVRRRLQSSRKSPDGWEPNPYGGMSGLILEVDDVFKSADDLRKNGVEFTGEPIHGLHSQAPVGAAT